jgi:triacylglycerol lipase
MLARLQQLTTLGLLVLAAAWAALAWRAGHAGWALGGALLIVFGYALVLAIEFALLRAVHADDPTPRATNAQLLRAWLGEVRALGVLLAPALFQSALA